MQRRSAEPNSEPSQTRYTQKNPWYYSAKRNNDVSRLAMRILKRSAEPNSEPSQTRYTQKN